MGKLDEKVALITGAGAGIGRTTALLFAREGAKVVVADYDPAGGQDTVKMIKEAGGEAIFVEADVSKAADAERMVKTVVDTYGRLDILHNNAGTRHEFIASADLKEEDWDRVINTNLKGVFLGSKYAIPTMLSQGGGVIINTASAAGIIGAPNYVAYAASKGGVIQLTKAMALEYVGQNIRVNCICPGVTQTPGVTQKMADDPKAQETFAKSLPGGRWIQPEEIAQAALYLASEDSCSVIGAALVIDLGLTIA